MDDWRKELKDRVGVSDTGDAADLSDVEGREFLYEQHLRILEEKQVKTDLNARNQ